MEPVRPPRLYKVRGPPDLAGNQRGFIHGGKFYIINSDLPDDELQELIQAGYDSPDCSYENPNCPGEIFDSEGLGDDEIPDDYNPLGHRGLFDNEINYIAEKLGLVECGYLGTYPIDKIHEIADKIEPGIQKFGFILNTDQSSGDGKHWIAVAYIAKNKELDYYDSLGMEPTDQFLEQIDPIIKALALPYYLKFKVNLIPRQGASWNCGYHAILFLYKVLCLNIPYQFASGFSKIRKGEHEIAKFKGELKRFGYI